jgi:hypothetical protein
MFSHLMIIKLCFIVCDQNFGEPKETYDILLEKWKHFVDSYLC